MEININSLKDLNRWASKLTLKEIENLSEVEILTVAMERPGHPGQFGFMLELRFFRSQDHLAKTMHALLQRIGKVEDLKEKMKNLKEY